MAEREFSPQVTCAKEIVPLWQLCGETAVAFLDDTFDGFSVAACAAPCPCPAVALDAAGLHLKVLAGENRLEGFIKPCRQTDLLYQRASHGSCAEASQVAGLPSRLQQINDLCCTQDGQNVTERECQAGVQWFR